MGRTIVNPSAGDVYYDVAGNAVSSSTTIDVNGGAVAGHATADLDNGGMIGTGRGDTNRVDETIVAALDGVNKANSSATLAYREENKFVIRGYSETLAGLANTSILYPASSLHRRDIDKVEAVRTLKVASAIRNNQWSAVSGDWINDPSSSSDLSSMGTDEVATVDGYSANGEFTYRYGAPTGVLKDYAAKG